MKRTPLLLFALTLAGCGGTTALVAPSTAPLTQSFGPLVTRVVGAAQVPVTASAANGANVTGLAGALVTDLTLNNTAPKNLADTRIVYSQVVNNNPDIYSVASDGSDLKRLTTDPGQDYLVSTSPDGSQIVFTRNDFTRNTIWVMNADGSNPRKLSTGTNEDFCPTWSPDGTKIGFLSGRNGSVEIFVMNADGTGQRLVYRGSGSITFDSLQWTADSKLLLFSQTVGAYNQIFKVALTGNAVQLTNDAAHSGQATGSPDGTKIAYIRSDGSGSRLYMMNTDGTAPFPVTTPFPFADYPRFSPDGTKQDGRLVAGL